MQFSQKVIDIGLCYQKLQGKTLKDVGGHHIRSIGLGKKIVKGKFTDIDSVVFSVKEKKPLSQLSRSEIIPPKLTIDGKEYFTDVMHCPKRNYKADCYGTNLDTWASNHRKKFRYSPFGFDTDIRVNQPLQGGISFGQSEGGTGTLGCIVEDLAQTAEGEEYTLSGLTNNHVIVKDAFYASEKSFLPDYGYVIKANNIFKKGTVQPGEAITGGAGPGGQTYTMPDFNQEYGVGYVKRYVPMYFWNWNDDGEYVYKNPVDAALSSIFKFSKDAIAFDPKNPENQLPDPVDLYILGTQSRRQYDYINGGLVFFQNHYEFASSEEINSVTTGTRIWKSGRTTGVVGMNTCPACIYQTNLDVNVYGYGFSQFSVEVLFSDIMSFTYASQAPDSNGLYTPNPLPGVIIGGDSGSVLIAEFNGVKKIIGLNFAGGYFSEASGPGSIGFACRIDHVAEMLEIRAINTEVINPDNNNYYSNFNQWKYIVVNGLSDKYKLSGEGLDGVYYQCGIV